MRRVFVFLVTTLIIAETAYAQYDLTGEYVPPEFFLVKNDFPHPVTVVVKSVNDPQRPMKWNFEVSPGNSLPIGTQLVAPQPYEVTIWKNNDEAIVLSSQKFCNLMRECRSQGAPYRNIRRTVTPHLWTREKNPPRNMANKGKIGTLNLDVAYDHVILTVGPDAQRSSPAAKR